ncbi:MAG: autotransporter-associated beta strand repeat-containing protein [Paludibacter sp.]|nr:autotransporter-associated beta strand repeat-containing protein [Paludibacter sp.]
MKKTTSSIQWVILIMILLVVCFLPEKTLAQATKTFTGSGNFSTAARWNGGTLPVAGDNLVIDGICTVDNNIGTDNLAFGTLTVGTATGRTLNWAVGGTNRLKVVNVSAGAGGSTLNMTNGGTLIIGGTWTSTNLAFTPGAGTIEIQSTMTLPAAYATYKNLTIGNSSATVTSGVITTVTGSLTVAGTLQLVGFNMTSGDLQGAGTIISSSGTPTITIGSLNTSTSFSGVIGSGAIAVTKNGTGALTLSGNNTYTGTTTIAAGTLKLGNTNALGTTAGGTSVTSGGVLDLNGINYSNAELLTLAGTGISSGGALINSNAIGATYAGNITLSTTAPTITANNPITLSGVISGGNSGDNNSLTIAGNSTLTGALTLLGNNTYIGYTTINSGALLKIGANNALGAGAPNGTTDTGDYNSTIINSGGVLDLNGITYTQYEGVRMNGAGFSAAGNGCIINSASTSAIYSGCVDPWTPSTLYVANPITFNGIVQCRYNNSITKTGSSTLTLAPTGGDRTAPSNPFFSAIIISSGTLKLGANLTETGSTSVYTRISSGAVLDLNGFTCARYLYLNGTGISSAGALINSSSTAATYSGLVILESASSIVGSASTIALSNSGTMTGPTFGLTLGGTAGGSIASVIGTTSGTVTKVDAGTWTLSGLNTYTGSTTISSGILRATNNTIVVSTNGAFGNNASGLILNGGTIQSNVATFSRPITVTATNSGLDAYGSARTISSTINNATASSSFNLNVGGTTVTSAEGQNLILSGVISNTAGSMSLTKIGTSVLTLSGANTYTGGTILNAGQVNINHAIAIGTGALTINGGIINNTSGGAITLSNNNAQNWNGDFTFTGSQSLNLGTGAVTLSANRQITVSANTLTVGGTINQPTLNLTKAGGGTLSFASQTVGLNNLTISAGTITSTSGALNLAGNFSNSGAFTHNSGTVNFNGTTAQTIGGSASTTFNNLTVANTASTVTLNINASIVSNLSVTNGIFDLTSYTANCSTAGGTLAVSNNATLKIGGTNPYPTNYSTNTLGATSTVEYSGTTQTVKGQAYSNLTISGAGTNYKTASADITVNGILNLNSANASATQGCLEMSSYILTMGANATTTGTGDVTGIVKRTSFVVNTSYSFGNQYTTFAFMNMGTLPTDLSVKISIGSAPTWKTGAVKRTYEVIQNGDNGSMVSMNLHYLDAELNGNSEDLLVHLDCQLPTPPGSVSEHGKYNYNITNNWVGCSNMEVSYFPTSFGSEAWTMGNSTLSNFTWNGLHSTDWDTASNWTPIGNPSNTSDVIIPDGTTTPNDPTLPTSTEIKSLVINANGILNSGSNSQLTIAGSSGAWLNSGTFNSGTSTVVFTNSDATMAGQTNFNNVTIDTGATLILQSGNIMRIAGTLTNNGILRAVFQPNTIEFNGTNQIIINPNGATPGYYNLILSGSGTKTMPGTALSIAGDLSLSGSASATAAAGLTIAGNVSIGSGTTLNLGSYSHTISGNMTNNGGTLTPSTSSITMNGSSSQTITSSAGISFNNLSITNTSANVTLGTSTNCSIAGDLTLNAGAVFDLAANSLTAVTGTVYNSGTIKTQSTSSTLVPSGKTWGGTFEFTGSTAQTFVGGTYNNVTTSGSGGITATANSTVNGILNLASVNPSSIKGILEMGSYTLLMGPSATTIGPGDVTGIVRRTTIIANTTYTLGNQYTTINFPNIGTLPSEISLKISIGTAPAWKPGAIKRIYDFINTGGSGTLAYLYCHYLDSELNGNSGNGLVDWLYISAYPLVMEYGRSGFNTSNKWVSMADVDMSFFSSSFGNIQVTLAESQIIALTWNGSVDTSWTTAENWTPNGAPSDNTAITIPNATTTSFNLTIPSIATCGKMHLQPGAILNTISGAQLTINGADSAWTNNGGVFNAGTSTLKFTNANASLIGTSDFYNVTIDNGAVLALEDSAYMGISGIITNNGSLLTVEKGATTVEYKGGNQTVIVPNVATDWYSTLILSGSGTKTLPGTTLEIYNDFSILGTTSTTAGATLNLDGDLTIGSGATFNTGNFDHAVGGNFYNNGTFTTSTGCNFILNGNTFQSIEGTGATTFNNLSILNSSAEGVFLNSDITINNSLSINSGSIMTINPAIKANIVGTVTNNAGTSGLVIKSSSSTANGTLIFHNLVSSPVYATVEMYSKASKPSTNYKWQFFGIPVRSTDASPTFNGSYVRQMHEDNIPAHWEQLNTASAMSSFTGYEITQALPTTIYFKGELENSDFAPAPLIFTTGATYPGEHLFANPYSAAIDITQLSFGSQTEASVYLYNTGSLSDWTANSGGSSNGVSPGQYTVAPKSTAGSGGIPGQIPSMQGFLVNALSSSANATFGIPYSSVVAKNTDQQRVQGIYKSSNSNKVFTRIDVKGEHFSDCMWIFSDPGCTHNFDNGWDGYKFMGSLLAPQLYTIEADGNYQVNSVDDMNNTVLGFRTGEDSTYTLTFTNENLETKYSTVYLIDLKNNITTDITQSGTQYSFNTSYNDSTQKRFKILTSPVLENPITKLGFNIFSSQQMIFVHNSMMTNGELYLYDISGKFIETIHFSANSITTTKMDLPSGTYLVKGVSGNQIVNQIIVI